ncbi:S1C family serine protease [Caldovatus aquaticus]|uniref:S1C family serine protease n=1 Tax=Caldovatus aquaticus TaxID=2865671 RepID=A0ABS7F0Z4_9PROT|nr:S1C family serine protease [Caldovatus aquaticus]MBW8268476.1 S1C family serine protease [Caldovatus aquaticus]
MANSEEDWEIPAELQPDPVEWPFPLDRALGAVLGLKSVVPEDAFTARTLGTERQGSGVLIRRDGLVLTIGYLIAEAESVWLTTAAGRVVPGHALAYDHESGFGLVQALGRLEDVPALEIGEAGQAQPGSRAVLAAAGGRARAVACVIAARQPFAGYWEYALDDAFYTAPAHPAWGGAALIGEDGRLLGIGSLILQRRDSMGRRLDLNMVVPVSGLAPILDDLLAYGRVNRPARPWLGLYASEDEEGVTVVAVAPGGPAEHAGVRPGDRLLAVGATRIEELGAFWKAVWGCGAAGAPVPLVILRGGRRREVVVESADRRRFLKAPRLH